MAQSAWLSASAGPDHDFGPRPGHAGFGLSSRLPPLSEIGRFTTGAGPSSTLYNAPRAQVRDKRMLDYSAYGANQAMYNQPTHDVSGDPVDGRHATHPHDATAYASADGYSSVNQIQQQQQQQQQLQQQHQYTYGYNNQAPYRQDSSSSLSHAYVSTSLYPNPQYTSSVSSFSSTGSAPAYDLTSMSSYGSLNHPYAQSNEPSITYSRSSDQLQDYSNHSPIYGDHVIDRRGSNLSLSSNYGAVQEGYGTTYDHTDLQLPTHTVYGNELRSAEPSPPSVAAVDSVHAIIPQVTNMLRDPSYDHAGSSMSSTPDPSPDAYGPSLDAMLADTRIQQGMASHDVKLFMRPFLDQYVRTPNRLAFGEKTIIVMSSKVAQKSYGTEKRFLCPPPTALMVGNSWWSDSHRTDNPTLRPPRVVISISGEATPPEAGIDWSGANGKSFNQTDPPAGTTYLGRCVGKQLYISDVDEKRKKVEALVKVIAPASEDGVDRVIGVFPSRPIKVISKPSKKRQSAKNLELCINHGTTVSLFHRLRSQTVSTRYLCVSGSASAIKGSDGAPLMGLDPRARTATPSFIAKTAAWDAFVLYIVDVNHASNGGESLLPPPQPDFPSPPPNAISYTNNGSPIPVYYNQTVVLQCLTSGVVSPVLIIRKVDHTTTAVGGGSSEHAKGTADQYCPPGEVCGDPVSQLHKIAFEVFDASTNAPAHGSPGDSGAFLSCMGEKVNTYRPVEGRIWSPRNESPMMSPVISPVSPLTASTSFGSMVDYFNPSGLGNGLGHGLDAPLSPSMEFESNGGGRVRKKRSTSSAGGLRSRGNRRRPASSGSGSLSPTTAHFPDAMVNPYQHAQWQVEIGETSVWTIVGVDQIRYNFYIPPMLLDSSAQHLASHSRSFPVPSKPVTPFPGVVKYLPADRAAEVVRSGHTWRPVTAGPDPSKMLTLYGENFVKTEPPHVFFGADVSPYVEVRCNEVVGCLPPDQDTSNHLNMRRPILLVRADGVVYPSTTLYP